MPNEETRWRNLAPASSKRLTSDGQVSDKDPDEGPSNNKKRRQLVNSACTSCQRRKRQCNGERPRCGYCRNRNLECAYTVPQGVSRSTFYVQRTRELENKVGELEKFISSLQSGTDEAATSILAQLRIGLPAQDILRGVESSEQLPSSHSPPAGAESHLSLQPAHNSHGAQPPYSARRPEEFHFPIFDRSGWRSLEVVSDHHNTKALPEEGETDSLLNAPMKDPNRGGVEPSSGSVDSAGRVSLQTSASRQLAQMQRRPGNSAYIDSTRFENNFITASPNLANNFGNLSFSNSVLSNHYPQNIQSQQVGNLFLQRWAMLTPTQEYASGMPNSTPNTWGSIREESQEALMNGAVLDDICGQHPYMKALLDNNSFMSSPKLSQWAAQSVYSIKRSSQPGMTEFVSMYTFWLVMRWMIQPSPQTFKAIPTWLRPTPTQLFTPHSLAWDFLVWPAFRSLLSERPDLGFVNLSWALEMSLTIAFNWPGTVEEGLCRNPLTGELDLSPDAKELYKDLTAWSVAPSFRQHLLNADAYVKIKYEDEE